MNSGLRNTGVVRRGCVVMALLGAALASQLLAGPVPPANPPSGVMAAVTNTHFKQVSPGLYQLGVVRLNKTHNTVSFPAAVNMEQGAVEYLVVSTFGKLHESVLKTEAEPYHIHLAMLLLNAKGAPKGELIEDYSKPVPGDPITLTVSWNDGGQPKRLPAETLVWDQAAKSAMAKGPWTYSGSRVFDGTFIAQRDRSIVAIIGDIDALINNPRPRRDQDENWQVNKKACPPLDTPVEVTIHLVPQPPGSNPKPSDK